MVLLSTLLMGAAPEVPPYAARVEGFVGGALIRDAHYQPDDQDALYGGGTASAVALFGPAYAQLDIFGDYADYDNPDARTVGVGGHLGVGSQDMGIIGISGAWQDQDWDPSIGGWSDPNSFWRVGLEGEYFLQDLSLGGQAGYATYDVDTTDGYYARGLFRYYLTEDLKLEGIGGVIDNEDINTSPVASFLAEYRVGSSPFSVFTRWETTFLKGTSSSDANHHTAVAGFRLYFDGEGATLKRADRAHFRDACTHALNVNRLC